MKPPHDSALFISLHVSASFISLSSQRNLVHSSLCRLCFPDPYCELIMSSIRCTMAWTIILLMVALSKPIALLSMSSRWSMQGSKAEKELLCRETCLCFSVAIPISLSHFSIYSYLGAGYTSIRSAFCRHAQLPEARAVKTSAVN